MLHNQMKSPPTLSVKQPLLVWKTRICLALVIITAVLYLPVRHYDFVNYDDPLFVTQNPHIQHGLNRDSVCWALTARLFDVDPNADYWRPLSFLSHALDIECFGLDPGGHHLMNLGFHVAAAVALFLALLSMTNALWRSAFVAALFAWHPLHVESVAWIAERKDVLSGLFWMLTMLMYGRYAQKRTKVEPSSLDFAATQSGEPGAGVAIQAPAPRRWIQDYCLALLFFILGLMSKPMVVTLPFALLLLDYWPLGRWRMDSFRAWLEQLPRLALEKAPFFLLSALSCIGTFLVQQQAKAVQTLGSFSFSGRMENMFVSYGRYLGKTFWPTVLACPYPHPGHWELSLVVYSVALIAGLSALAVLYARRYPFFFTGWFWFVGTLIPVIGLVQVGGQPMADRYTYIPLIGLFIAFVWGLGETALSRPVPKTLIVVLTAMILVACAWRTRNQLSYWRDSETLFRHTLAVTKDNYIACNNLGTWLSKRGQIAEAMDYFHKSLKINPDGSDVLYNLANTFAKLGNWDEAITNYQRALQITPNQSDILDNLGFALAAKKQFADAVVCFEAALKLNPDCADAHNNLATVLFIQKKIDGAVRHFREALRLTPGNPQIYSNLADALVKQGQTAEAVRCYQEALRLKPGDPQIKAKLQALGAQLSN